MGENGNGKTISFSLSTVVTLMTIIVAALVFYFSDYNSLCSDVRAHTENLKAHEQQFERVEKQFESVDAKLDRLLTIVTESKGK